MKWCKCFPCTKVKEEDVIVLDFSCSLLMEVPDIVFNFERTLQFLYLDCNKIMELPRTLFQCEELCYLGLSDNEIETLPPLIEKLSNLETLLLSRNCLVSESIPANIHRCQKLKILHLSSNSIIKVPGSITRLVLLRELYLNNCDLDFLPANFGRLNNLQILELRENNLVTLPKSLKRLTDLRRLDISSNMFKIFPEVIGAMINLVELWLNDNLISEIPDCIGALQKLSHFDASCNHLQGISNNLELCINMTLLLFSMNDLKELPSTIGHLPLLHTLKLDYNFLTFLPSSIGKLSNLEELDVQFNNLKSFPNSIGMLRKLNSLVAARNSISYLPSEIGSCTALSVLSLHCNMLMYLPQEIGHLQNLTSINLIKNRLRYLPITILSLKKLKALWLSHNQNQPLITLQTETLDNGQIALVCVFLPQVEVLPDTSETKPTIIPSGRRIGFKDQNMGNVLPTKLNRIPTPHPKAFVKYQRTLEATFWRNHKSISPNISADGVYVKEANIIPMKGSNEESVIITDDSKTQREDVLTIASNGNNIDTELAILPLQEKCINGSTNSNEIMEIHSEGAGSIGSARTPSSLDHTLENILVSDNASDNLCVSGKSSIASDKDLLCIGLRPKQPPPYHIAAAFSKTAHLFTNIGITVEEELEPKYFTQNQPTNILNPQPKRAFYTQKYEHMHNNHDIELLPSFENNIETNEKIIRVAANLLILDYQQYRSFIEDFLVLKNEQPNASNFSSNILEKKLQILQTAKYLILNVHNSLMKQNYLVETLQHMLDYLEAMEGWPDRGFLNNFDVECRQRLYCIRIAIILLQTDSGNIDHQEIIEELLHIHNTHLHINISNVKFEINPRNVLQAKIFVINLAIQILTLDTNSKEYQCILEEFTEVQRKLEYCDKLHFRMFWGDIKEFTKGASFNANYLEMDNGCHPENCHKRNIRSPKIIKVELTPCCYVLGFTFFYNDEGVFVDEVDKNGNAHQKLFPGDKILMLDDRDISKMNAEDSVKAVQIWGPETEIFLVCRS